MEFKVLFINGKTKSFKTERGMRNFVARKSAEPNNNILMYGLAKYINIFMGGHSIGDRFKGKSIPEAVSEQAAQYDDALIEILKRQES